MSVRCGHTPKRWHRRRPLCWSWESSLRLARTPPAPFVRLPHSADAAVAALAPPEAGEAHGLVILRRNVMDRSHNTTRFFVIAPGEPQVDPDDDKTTIVFTTAHRPGALALALTELGLRGANLTRIESRPSDEAWSYRFFVDLVHAPGPDALAAVIDPPPATLAHLQVLGSYRSRT